MCYALEYLGFHVQHLKQDTVTSDSIAAFLRKLEITPGSHLLQDWANSMLPASPFIKPKPTIEVRNKMFHAACWKGLHIAVEILLLLRADVNSKDEEGLSPLWRAAEHGQAAVVDILMAKDADRAYQDSKKQTALSRAAYNDRDAVVKCLADFVPHSPDSNQETPLSYAAANGHDKVVRILIEGTRNNNAPYRANLMATNNCKQTPLSQAAENGHQRVALVLLEWGASLESKDIYDMTPLFRAAYNGQEAMVRLLIEKGASIHCKDTYGENPLSWAAQNGHEKVVKLLMEKGVASDDRDADGRTPLSRAAGKGHIAVMMLLLRNGAMADSYDAFHRSPLSWAACNGYTAVARLLLQAGVQIDSQASNGRTPLSWAAGKGHYGVVELLISLNVDIGHQDHDGLSSLAWAARYDHVKVTNLLQQGRIDNRYSDRCQAQMLLTASSGHQGSIHFPAIENPGQPRPQQTGDGSSTAAADTGENTHDRELVMNSLNRSRSSYKLPSIKIIHSPAQSSPSIPYGFTVGGHIPKRGISAGGREDTHRPAGVIQGPSSDRITTDSENTTIPNADIASSMQKMKRSLSRGYSPPAKRRRVD